MNRRTRQGKLLRVTAPHFCAGAVWQRDGDGEWTCTEAAPILRWMLGKTPTYVQQYLGRKGWDYDWVEGK